MFTPGREFKNPLPIQKDQRENPFRKKKDLNKERNFTRNDDNTRCTGVNVCGNCGIQGHPQWKCNKPLSSYGIIVVKRSDNAANTFNNFKVALITRKDSYDYMTLIKNIDVDSLFFEKIAKGITLNEKQKILTRTFQEMWDELYGHTRFKNSKKLFNMSKERFEKYNIRTIVYNTPDNDLKEIKDWSIPKGKPIKGEQWKNCALRELKEETNISSDDLLTISDEPIYHLRTGSDGRSYLGVYFIAIAKNSDITLNPQYTEVERVSWKSIKYLKEISGFPYKDFKKNVLDLLQLS